ncbi:DUF2924 domain-containing protein [Wolbachia pipientis]|uniref:DUF2924 domain-containing protein n=1 Tax=Wolbachia pipientis TaxID=955 RepID=UPI00203065DD|nr:DUF2924 domain-containing protein [Wolbachia pipientis]MCM1001914.1 DUF2924 domain-containing protein [Wolbachia pipientis]
METSELTLLDLQNFLDSLKGHVRSEVEKYVDKRAEEVKNEIVTYIMYTVLNNMLDNKLPATPEVNKSDEVIQVDDDLTQNQKVVKALFIGKTLIGKYKGKTYEVAVSNKGRFIYNGKEYDSPSAAGTGITGKSCNGWDFFKVCLNPEEGLRTLSYYCAEFLSAQNSNI